jgi:hypothetical protein
MTGVQIIATGQLNTSKIAPAAIFFFRSDAFLRTGGVSLYWKF